MKVTELYLYPIKSCQGIALSQAEVTDKGFLWDREFMLVNQEGEFLTQRQYPLLATVKVRMETDTLVLESELAPILPLRFKPKVNGKEIEVHIWRDRTMAIDQGDGVAEWFDRVLQLKGKARCRLVKQSSIYPRLIDPNYRLDGGQTVSFADGYPFLLTTTASLADLNRRLAAKYPRQEQQVPMNRFRPNIVIETSEPFIESTWQKIQIGEVNFAVVKPCSRCLVTTTEQTTGERNPLNEPLATLSSFRRFSNQGVMFGENLIAESQGSIYLNDSVIINDF